MVEITDTDYLALDDAALLAQCEVNIHRASGPGGQHRNKVSTAVRLLHRPTGISAQACDSRSQHENRRRALQRLRMNLACRVRRPLAAEALVVPEVVRSCLHAVPGGSGGAERRLQVGRKDRRFWPVAQFLLDLLEACDGRLAGAAGRLGISTSNLVSVLAQDRHLLGAAQELRRRHGRGPIKHG